MKQLSLFLLILLPLLSGCMSTRKNISLFESNNEDVNIPKEKALVLPKLEEYTREKYTVWRNLNEWDNAWISYTKDRESANYTAEFSISNCYYDNWGLESFLWLLTLGIIPAHRSGECDISMTLKNSVLELNKTIGVVNSSEWIGWIALVIPDKTLSESFIDEKDNISSTIAYELYNSNSSLSLLKQKKKRMEEQELKEKKAIQKQIAKERLEKENKIKETLDDDIENTLKELGVQNN